LVGTVAPTCTALTESGFAPPSSFSPRRIRPRHDEAIFGAVVVELIHTATLIHDDSVDKSSSAAVFSTVNSAFSNDTAILMGDYLYSKAFSILVNKRMYEAMDLSQTRPTGWPGELRQIRAEEPTRPDGEGVHARDRREDRVPHDGRM